MVPAGMPEALDPPSFALRAEQRPAALSDLPDPPAELHVRGHWPGAPCIAIVGSRASTSYGRAVAHRLAGDLARLGITIVSGLARGIDAAAHEGALDAGGVTVAVLPGSLDRITPPSHTALAGRIVRHGALVAEWGEGVPVSRGLFLRRNRLIAGLSLAVVVVEAAQRSGALATAAIARKLGRPVLAVPGDIDRPSSRGCNALLREGARVCEAACDVLDAVGPLPSLGFSFRPEAVPAGEPAGGAAAGRGGESGTQHEGPGTVDTARIAAILDASPRELEGLSRRAGIAPERTLAALLELQWAGVATTHPGPRWTASRIHSLSAAMSSRAAAPNVPGTESAR